jgi:CheY-like chemotaxis protein
MADDNTAGTNPPGGSPSGNSGPGGAKRKLVLVAEDDEKTRNLVGQVMRRGGYRVALAEDGINAANLLKRAIPDLIILDLRMPRMDGFQLLEILKRYETSAEIPIIVLTGIEGPVEMDRALRLGITDFLVKPISPRKLLLKVRAIVGK